MNLKRQLLLVSLLTLMLPWAGCEFIRETESALRTSQQSMLADTARAFAHSLSDYRQEFPDAQAASHLVGEQLFGHSLQSAPNVDGYFDDWLLDENVLRSMQGGDGPIRFATGVHGDFVYLFVHVTDKQVVYADATTLPPVESSQHADRVQLISANPPYLEEQFSFAAEAPGPIVAYRPNAFGFTTVALIRAFWQDTADGYQLEARVPRNLLGTHLGIVVTNTAARAAAGIRSASYSSPSPGVFVETSAELTAVIAGLVQQSGMRLMLTDRAGWRIASVGNVDATRKAADSAASVWLQYAYSALVEPGDESTFAEPDPRGREQQSYVQSALDGQPAAAWFRGEDSGRAIVSVAQPVEDAGTVIGSLVLQMPTDAILSLTNQGLSRLMNVSIIAMFVVGAVLLGYASLLSRRIRQLSAAAEEALLNDQLHASLPSSEAADEIGDLSRSFGFVLGQLGDYNEYLRTLASKLSHELRTPLAIVSSSLENLEHEALDDAARGYTARAKDGAERLRRILSAMSEASRVEELMKNAEPEQFDLAAAVQSAVNAYRDVYDDRQFELACSEAHILINGAPELLIQMLDKLIDNAVSFSVAGNTIDVSLSRSAGEVRLDVTNPGEALPERMRSQLFDSMVSVRRQKDSKHLGLGLYVARLIVDGHNGRIEADNVEGGVRFSVFLPDA